MEDQKAKSHRIVELFAARCAREHGRGLVVAAVNGSKAELLFVPIESWTRNPLPALKDDARLATWLAEYNLDHEFILVEAISDNEDMIVYPLRLPYGEARLTMTA